MYTDKKGESAMCIISLIIGFILGYVVARLVSLAIVIYMAYKF